MCILEFLKLEKKMRKCDTFIYFRIYLSKIFLDEAINKILIWKSDILDSDSSSDSDSSQRSKKVKKLN